MKKLTSKLGLSFSTKVLLPVVTLMVLPLAITVWLVNARLTQQFQIEAGRNLGTADAVLQHSQTIRSRNLLLRYRNLPKEPRYKALFQSGDQPTLRSFFAELMSEQGLDVILFTTLDRLSPASATRDPLVPISEFETACARAVQRALDEQETADAIRVGDRIFDVVSIPVQGAGDITIGALTLGSEVGNAAAQELRDSAQCQIVLMANNRPIASTVSGPESREQFSRIFADCIGTARPNPAVPPRIAEIQLNEEHYFCSAGRFPTLSGDGKLGYVLLSSYERPWRALRNTQQMLLSASALAVLIGTAIVWLLVRNLTQPLRALRDSAEAVGRGDFSQSVKVYSSDECGELAAVFNQMTQNLKQSRQQLETTVETLKTTQAHLIQSEKLSGIGEFVAGVAHELNNPLTSVMGFSELLQKAEVNPQLKRCLEMIHKSALRCQKIVQSLLSFARRHEPERKLSNVNELLEAAIDILHYQMRTSNIEVITSLDPQLPKTMLDPHQVQQVFLNIINNARQAIEAHQPAGWVRVSTETRGSTLRITLQDSGPGIAPENLSKVFDPFFTTKDVGKGTGLGLSLCYGIIKEHGGQITVRSKPGEGATFVVELPLTEEESSKESAEVPALAPAANEGAGKKVLVIDDEEPILQMVREALGQHGYEVDVATDGESALQRLDRTHYDLALCDWKMPGLNGEQVYERLRTVNPALSERLIFITGDVINERTQRFLQERKKLCLAKPFTLSDFRAAVGKALAAT